jgi:hypothetical protein
MKKAETTVGDSNRAQAWANVDNMLTGDAVAIPWVFDKQPYVISKDVRAIYQLWNEGSIDYSYSSLK